jgi:hypothetical protein
MTATSMNPDKTLREMMETIDSLKKIYVSETSALNATDTKGFLALQESKLEIARRYKQGVEFILKNKDGLKSASPALKNRLGAMYNEFTAIANENVTALKRMQRCTERLGHTIMNAARDAAKQQRTFSYAENGSIRGSTKKSVSMGVSETA